MGVRDRLDDPSLNDRFDWGGFGEAAENEVGSHWVVVIREEVGYGRGPRRCE